MRFAVAWAWTRREGVGCVDPVQSSAKGGSGEFLRLRRLFREPWCVSNLPSIRRGKRRVKPIRGLRADVIGGLFSDID